MIEFITGDIFDTKAPAIGHGVNCSGVMGAGIAAVIRKKYPSVYEEYRDVCQTIGLQPGDMLPLVGDDSRWIFNIASQDKPGPDARIEWLESAMVKTFAFCSENEIPSFAIPRIGAGIGGLEWEDVKEVLIELAWVYADVNLEVWTLPA